MMKKILGLLAIFAIVLTSCTGDQGPEGPPGIDAAMPLVFETTQNLKYNESNGLWVSDLVFFADNKVTPLPQDVFLAYRLEKTTESGEDVWSPLPQNFFLPEGTIQYIFNFSVNGAAANNSAEFIIDGNFDLANLDTGYTDKQVFRLVIVPASIAQDLTSDFSNFNAVMKDLNLSENDILK